MALRLSALRLSVMQSALIGEVREGTHPTLAACVVRVGRWKVKAAECIKLFKFILAELISENKRKFDLVL